MRRAPPATARAVALSAAVPTTSAIARRGLARRSVRVMATASRNDDDEGYRSPPPDVAQFVERPQSPGMSISPHRDKLLYTFRPPPIPSSRSWPGRS